MKKTCSLTVLVGLVFLALSGFSQETEIRPVVVGQEMPDFTLPVYQGGQLTLSELKGKNVLIVFPRGYAAEGRWCTICNYRYADLVDDEMTKKLREKYNTEILYVLPYNRDIVKQWLEDMTGQLEKIQEWKNPPEPDKLDEKGKNWMERARKAFPKDLSFEEGNVPVPFPILIDEERKLTKRLGIFMTEWSESKVDQLIPSVYIVDKNGVLQFKYIGQNTWDRPGDAYLAKILEMINKE